MNRLNDIFQGFVGHFVHDWHHNPTLFWLEAAGFVLGIGAALVIAIMGSATPFFWAFLSYAISSVCLIIAGYMRKSSFFVMLQVVYLFINITGMCAALIALGVFL